VAAELIERKLRSLAKAPKTASASRSMAKAAQAHNRLIDSAWVHRGHARSPGGLLRSSSVKCVRPLHLMNRQCKQKTDRRSARKILIAAVTIATLTSPVFASARHQNSAPARASVEQLNRSSFRKDINRIRIRMGNFMCLRVGLIELKLSRFP